MRLLYIFILQFIITTVFSSGSLAASLPPTGKIIVTNSNDSGVGSLRAAIDTANKYIGPDTIIFDYSNLGYPIQITISTGLVATDTVVIDATDNTYANAYTGIPIVSVSGNDYYVITFSGVGASNSVLKGLHFSNNYYTCVYGNNVNNLTISGCYIMSVFSSTNSDWFGSYTGDKGIELSNCNNTTIGGTGTNDPNVIYSQTGIYMSNCLNGNIKNNFIGANRSGNMPGFYYGYLPYIYTGINLYSGTSGITIDGNIVGNYSYSAITIGENSTDPVCKNNIIQNNIIGASSDLYSSLPNGIGLYIGNGDNNEILNNKIINNYNQAIFLTNTSFANKISQNILSCNNGGSIELNSGNTNYPAPVLSDTAFIITDYNSDSSIISGKAQPNDIVEIFYDDGYEDCGHKVYFDGNVVANASGDWTFVHHGSSPGIILTTATSPTSNNTSSFSSATLKHCGFYGVTLYPERDTVCSGIPLNFSLEGSGNYFWQTTGTGTFSPDPNNDYPSYIPGPGDTTSIIITVNVKGVAPCPAVYDKDTIVFIPSPIAHAGPDQHVCASSPTVTLAGSLSHSPSAIWSSTGSGTFINNTLLNTVYPVAPNDTVTDLPYIEVYLDPSSNGNVCSPIRDTVRIYFDHNNKVSYNGPADTTICSNYYLTYQGSITNYGLGYWKTSGTGTYSDSSYYQYWTYQQSPKDTVAKSVVLTLVADNGVCKWDSTKATLRFRSAPVAITGVSSDTTICKTNTLKLNGTVYNTNKFHWNTYYGQGTFIQNDSSLSVTYVPAPHDWSPPPLKLAALAQDVLNINNPYITISLLTDSALGCPPSESSFDLYFATPPNPDSIIIQNTNGSQITACQGLPINLNASYNGDDTGYTYLWTTKGSGPFTILQDSSAVYQPSDLDNRKVLVPFTVAMKGVCYTTKDLQAIILPLPDAGIGTQEQICPEDSIVLSATAPGIEQAGYWKLISGAGKFADSTNSNGHITSISESINVYRWTISDSSTGCVNHTDYTVYKCYAPQLDVYNAVSPNNDGMHDFLEIDNIDAYKDNKVIIYNRWGEKVFEMDNYNNKDRVFTGISNVNGANELPIGPYYYQIKINNKISKGYLVLRR